MTLRFYSLLSDDLQGFLLFKRSLGYRYTRAEFTLLEFDRFVQKYAEQHRTWQLDQAIVAWLASKPQRKAVSVSMDAAVLRQFCSYLRRRPGRSPVHEPLWPQLPTESTFTPCVLSDGDIKQLLELSATLTRPPFRAPLFRALILLLYCTGLRVGEALRLRLQDVDTHSADGSRVQSASLNSFSDLPTGGRREFVLTAVDVLPVVRPLVTEVSEGNSRYAGSLHGLERRVVSSDLQPLSSPPVAPALRRGRGRVDGRSR
jgi:integrase